MIGILAIAILIFSSWRLLVSLLNYWLPVTVKATNPGHVDTPLNKLSILIPVRNEAENLPVLFDTIRKIKGDPEIIFCNDHSEDRSVALIEQQVLTDPRIRLIHAPDLPSGWFGKSHACHTLAAQAHRAYYLFLDADVDPDPEGIEKALRFIVEKNLSLLSLFPYQVMHTRGERATVPIMLRCLLSMLPLRCVSWKLFPSLAAANGQFMLFKASDYQKLQPHKYAHGQRAEDIAIARMMKKNRYRIACLLGNGIVSCRMYHDYRSGINGFAKNLDCFFGKSLLLTFFYGISSSLLGILIVWSAIVNRAEFQYAVFITLAFLLILLCISLMNLKAAGFSPVRSFPWIFVQDLTFFHIFMKNLWFRLSGKGEWKGRSLLLRTIDQKDRGS